ncbi:hypothetical protein MXL46_13450 [Heyndrickxia sporothermodurans]|uniref:hypothetical protein n=1 Tax=Heyndrickxia sporothermodurans TaxID=46224 RepID=UPI002DB5A2EA|nr:hypothetical protein [Heyndrickxia sporothermodurans]MEB6550095.1 hypothetical protein [Heyndrickxia sporothermodurans]
MLPFPQKFDQNEWCIVISIVISYAIILFLPKRFPLSITILIMLFGTTVARISDYLLAISKLDLYTVMDTEKYELFDLITYILYAPFAYIFVYVYDKYNIKGYWVLLYLLICSIGATFYEHLNKVLHVFNYHDWKLIYSQSVYLFVQCIALLFFHLIRKLHRNLGTQTNR